MIIIFGFYLIAAANRVKEMSVKGGEAVYFTLDRHFPSLVTMGIQIEWKRRTHGEISL